MTNPLPIPPSEASPQKPHRRLRRVLSGLGVALLVVLLLLTAAAVFLQTEAGRSRVQAIAVAQLRNILAEDATVTVERIDGNFLTQARVLGLRVEKAGRPVIEIDTARVHYSLLPLLWGTFSSDRVDIAGLRVLARQREDGSLDVAELIEEEAEAPEEEAEPFTVRIGSVRVSDGALTLAYWPPDADSTLRIDSIMLDATEFYSGAESLRAEIDRLALRAAAPHDASSVDLVAAGSVSSAGLAFTVLDITSKNGTAVVGSGRLGFGEGALPSFNGELSASPLALADVRAFFGVPVRGSPDFSLTSTSNEGDTSFEFRASMGEARALMKGELLTNPDDGALSYALQGSLTRFNPSELIVGESLDAVLNGTLSTRLKGDSLQALTGPFSLDLTDSRIGEQPIDAFTVGGQVADGRATFELASALPGARFSAVGSARPFDSVPSLRADVQVEELDLARLTGNAQRHGSMTGTLSIDAQGSSLETLSGSAGVVIEHARYNRLKLVDSRIETKVTNGVADFVTNLSLSGGGDIEASGQVDLANAPLSYSVQDARFRGLNLERVTGDTALSSDLTGRFSLRGRGIAPESATATGEIHLVDSSFGSHTIEEFSSPLRLQQGSLAFDASADLGEAGWLTARGTARPFAVPLSASVTGTMRGLDLAALTRNATEPSDLSGTYTARLRGTDPQSLALDARLELEPSRYGTQAVDGGVLNLSLDRGALSLTGDLQTPEGLFAVDISGRPFDDSPTLRLGERTCFSGLDLRRLTGNPDLETDLNGCIRGQLSGLDPKTATIDATVSLQASRLAEADISGGEATINLADGFLRTTATVALLWVGTAPRRAALQLSGRPFDEEPHLSGSIRTQHLDLSAFSALLPGATLPQTDLDLTLDSLEIRGTNPETMTLRARLVADGSRIGDIRIDTLRSAFRLDGGVLTVDRSRMRSNFADATGAGTVALFDSTSSTDYLLEGQIHDVSLVSGLIDGPPVSVDQGTFSLRMQGVPGFPFAIEGMLEAENVVYGDSAEFAAQHITSQISGEITPNLQQIAVQGQTRFQDFRVPGVALPLRRGDLLLAYDNEAGLTVQVNGRLDDARKVSVAAAVRRGPTGTVLELDAVNLTLGGEDWYLARKAEIEVGDVIRIRNLLLRTGDGAQQIAADGQLDFDGELRLIATAENIDLQPFTDLIPPRGTFRITDLGGTLWGTVFLRGTAASPEILTFLSVENLTSQGQPFGALLSRIDYEDERLTINANLAHESGRTLTLSGHLPQRISLAGRDVERVEGEVAGNVNLVIDAENFPVAWARPFLNPDEYSDIGGLLTTDSLTVTGTYDDLNLTGGLSLTDGRLGVTTTGVTFEPLNAELRFTDNRIVLDDVHITDPGSGERRLDITGDITFENLDLGRLDLTIQPNGLLAMDNETYRGLVLSRGSQPLHLTGTLTEPVLRGSVTLDRADILITEELLGPDYQEITLTPTQIREVETLFGQLVSASDTSTVDFIDALDYDLDIEIDRNVWLRSRAGMPFDVEIEGTVDARKPPFAESTNLFGTIDLVRGTVQMPGLPGKRFTLEEGAITLNGDPLAAQLDLSATLDTRLKRGSGAAPITITMGMTGQFNENPEIRLSSNPALSAADIISVVATGQLSQDIGLGAGGEFAFGMASGALSGLVEGAASQALGLDVVQLDVESNGTVVINLGKYLTERAFASVGYRLGNNDYNALQNRSNVVVGLDYELLRWLMLQAEQGGRRGTGAGLGFEYDW